MGKIFLKIILLKKNFSFFGYFWVSVPLKKKFIKLFKILNSFSKILKIFLNFPIFKKKIKILFFHELGEKNKNTVIVGFECLKIIEILLLNSKEFENQNKLLLQILKKKKNIFSIFSFFSFFKKKNFFFFTIPLLHEKDSLWNDLFHFLLIEKKNFENPFFFFNFFCFLNIAEESLWILDSQYNKFLQRKIHGGKIFMPPLFLINFFGSKIYKTLWRISTKINIKRKYKILKESKLRKLSQIIQFLYNSQNFIFYNYKFKLDWIEAIGKLSETFISYADYNKVCLNRTTKNHLRKVFRDRKRFMEIKTIQSFQGSDHSKKNSLVKIRIFFELKKLKNYFPFDIFSLLPLDKQERAKFLGDLEFPFPIEILKYFPGGNKRKTVVCWKIPKNQNQTSIIKKNILITNEMSNFPLFYSRTMLKTAKNEKVGI